LATWAANAAAGARVSVQMMMTAPISGRRR
jgi:hypothetical protein